MKGDSRLHRLLVQGTVQGVGFRPHLVRCAQKLKITGFCFNSGDGLSIFVKSSQQLFESFVSEIQKEAPAKAKIENLQTLACLSKGEAPAEFIDGSFLILENHRSSSDVPFRSALADTVPCEKCLEEMQNPADRRFEYPFTSCCECGPRYSILENAPFERANSGMQIFPMCKECMVEYQSSSDRRFHAVTQSCSACGPKLSHPVTEIVQVISEGGIVAIKGVGGYQFLCLAFSFEAVAKLRKIKNRPEQPFAILCHDLHSAEEWVNLCESEKEILKSPAAPILVCDSKKSPSLASNINLGLSTLGVMLPSSPLYYLIAKKVRLPIVCTSANISGQMMCADDDEAFELFGKIVDLLVSHNRPIYCAMDDSVIRVINQMPSILRSARGFYPNRIEVPLTLAKEKKIVAVGAQLKNTISLVVENAIYTSLPLGDLSNEKSFTAFNSKLLHAIGAPSERNQTQEIEFVCDLNPSFVSSQRVEQLSHTDQKLSKAAGKVFPLQHHLAHLYSNLAENQLRPPIFGVIMDGFGLGEKDQSWGGEVFFMDKEYYSKRVASLHPFPLLVGEKTFKDCRLPALGMLYETFGIAIFEDNFCFSAWLQSHFKRNELLLYKNLFENPKSNYFCLSSSCGRLFDGFAALLGVASENTFEAEAAMKLESLATGAGNLPAPLKFDNFHDPDENIYRLDWRNFLKNFCENRENKNSKAWAAIFHAALANSLQSLLQILKSDPQFKNASSVALSGGCFQNKILSENLVRKLKEIQLEAFTHSKVPANDSGISVGQAIYQLIHQKKETYLCV